MRWLKNIYIQSRVIGAEHSKSWKIISSAHSRAWLTIKIFFTPLPTESSWAPCHQGCGSGMASFPKQAYKKKDSPVDCWINLTLCVALSGFLTKSNQRLPPQQQTTGWLVHLKDTHWVPTEHFCTGYPVSSHSQQIYSPFYPSFS